MIRFVTSLCEVTTAKSTESMRFVVESWGLATARTMFGDEAVAEYLFDQEYDAGFVSRHTHQLASLWQSYYEAQVDDSRSESGTLERSERL